jgi:tripartite-type tricarboxylate transporter receptor subunit TctC
VIARLNNEIRAAISAPDVSERLIAIGLEPVMSDANEFSEFVKTEITKWSKVVKAAGLQPD